MMIVDIRIEIRTARLNHNLAQQPAIRELVQCVVDGGERNPDRGRCSLAMQLLGRDVPIAAIEQQARQGNALPRRPEPDTA